MGRLSVPLLRRSDAESFQVISWSDAAKLAAARLGEARSGWSIWCEGSSSTNEGYHSLLKLAQVFAARQAKVVLPQGYARSQRALERCFGVAASTASLGDLGEAELVLSFGNPLSSDPLLANCLARAEERGATLETIPAVNTGQAGEQPSQEQALLAGVLKGLLTSSGFDREEMERRVGQCSELVERLEQWHWDELISTAKCRRERIEQLVAALQRASSTVMLVGNDFAQAQGGSETLTMLLALAASAGLIGRPGSGVLSMGGGSAAQGALDLGISPELPSPTTLGSDRLVYVVGRALADALVSEQLAAEPVSKAQVRIHQAHFIDNSMLINAGELTLLLPMQSRYGQRGGCTLTSVDRTVHFSPEIRGNRIADARPDWEIPALIAQQAESVPEELWAWLDSGAVRVSLESAVPAYQGLSGLHAPGQFFQWGGATLHRDGCATEDGKARFAHLSLA
ncbi:MAG: hypothetical protein CMP23_01355 [Rickettsiales bacterium]|nr:hypothetical protein [Rickettsiales bacterium]